MRKILNKARIQIKLVHISCRAGYSDRPDFGRISKRSCTGARLRGDASLDLSVVLTSMTLTPADISKGSLRFQITGNVAPPCNSEYIIHNGHAWMSVQEVRFAHDAIMAMFSEAVNSLILREPSAVSCPESASVRT